MFEEPASSTSSSSESATNTSVQPNTNSEVPQLPREDTAIYGGWKFVNAEGMQVVREAPSYRSKAVTYLPRNYRVEVINLGLMWSRVRFDDGTTGYMRTKYLRDQRVADDIRNDSMLFQRLDAYEGIDVKTINVAHALNVRSRPGVNGRVKTTLTPNVPVVVLDSVNGWYEVRFSDSLTTGWIRSKFVK